MVNPFSVNSDHLIQRDDRPVETGPMPVELMRDSVKADLSRAFNLHEGNYIIYNSIIEVPLRNS